MCDMSLPVSSHITHPVYVICRIISWSKSGFFEILTQRLFEVQAGMQLAYTDGGSVNVSAAVDLDSATAWRENRLMFKDRELGDVLAQLGR
jgi:ferric-dicitrate binding protein FerR (iron transport regulator)